MRPLSSLMKYNRNWAWECAADVELEKETCVGYVMTNNKGQIKYLHFDDIVWDFDNQQDLTTLKGNYGLVAVTSRHPQN